MDSRSSISTPPVGLTFFVFAMFYGAVANLVSLRLPVGLASCALYIVLGIGLLKLYRWAQVATVVVSILNVGNLGMALVNGFRQWHLTTSMGVLLRLLFYALIVCYLLLPDIRLAFTHRVRDVSAIAAKT
jgi:hypothetical protein